MAKKHDESLKKKYKVKNWAKYDVSLRNRGDLTVWITEEAVKHWMAVPSGKRGRQLKYSELAIEAAAKVRLLFSKRLRQTEGFLISIIKLMGVDLPVPDHTTMSRRMKNMKVPEDHKPDKGPVNIVIDSSGLKIYGEGEWNQIKHGEIKRKSWRKIHITINDKGEIVAHKLTPHTISDPGCVNEMLDQIEARVSTVLADGGYGGNPTYNIIESKVPNIIPKIIIPPQKRSNIRKNGNAQRNQHVEFIRTHGRKAWEVVNHYSRRLLVENTIYRYKTIIGRKLNSRQFDNQRSEANIACNILNRMVKLGMPISVPA